MHAMLMCNQTKVNGENPPPEIQQTRVLSFPDPEGSRTPYPQPSVRIFSPRCQRLQRAVSSCQPRLARNPLPFKISQAIKTYTAESLTKAGKNSFCDTQKHTPPFHKRLSGVSNNSRKAERQERRRCWDGRVLKRRGSFLS